jgi:hypothetical protein
MPARPVDRDEQASYVARYGWTPRAISAVAVGSALAVPSVVGFIVLAGYAAARVPPHDVTAWLIVGLLLAILGALGSLAGVMTAGWAAAARNARRRGTCRQVTAAEAVTAAAAARGGGGGEMVGR